MEQNSNDTGKPATFHAPVQINSMLSLVLSSDAVKFEPESVASSSTSAESDNSEVGDAIFH